MDPVSQTLLGAVSAQLGFRQKIGRDATWAAALAAASPDLDLFLVRPLQSLVEGNVYWSRVFGHRGLSHSLLAMPFWVLPIALLWWGLRALRNHRLRRRGGEPPSVGFGWLYLCVLVAGLTHPLLDWCTSYGTLLLAPLTTRRFALDCVAIIDPLFTGLMVFVLGVCWLSRRRAPGRQPALSRRLGIAGMLLIVGYLAAGRVLHDRAIDRAREALGDNAAVLRADAYPLIGSLLLWRVVLETPEGYHAVRVHHLNGNDPTSLARTFVPREKPDPWIDRARKLQAVQNYLWFASGRVRAERFDEDAGPAGQVHRIVFHDLRYTLKPEASQSIWTLEIILDRRGRLLAVRRQHPGAPNSKRPPREEWIRELWRQQVSP